MRLDYTLTQTSDVKEYLNISASTYDVLIEKLVYGVTEFIQGYLGGRYLKESTITELQDGENISNQIILKQYPVSSVTSLSYKSGSNSSPTWNVISADNYDVNLPAGLIKRVGIPTGVQNVKIIYVAGYKIDFANRYTSTHTLPHDLSLVATQLVAKIFDKRFSEGKTNEAVEGQSVAWTYQLSEEMKATLGKYQHNRL